MRLRAAAHPNVARREGSRAVRAVLGTSCQRPSGRSGCSASRAGAIRRGRRALPPGDMHGKDGIHEVTFAASFVAALVFFRLIWCETHIFACLFGRPHFSPVPK